MPATLSLFGERSLTLVAADFPDRRSALRAADTLWRTSPLRRHDVAVVAPGDRHVGRTLEPEQRGIWRTLVRTHVILGSLGLVAGLLFAAALVWGGWPAAAASPGLLALFTGISGAFFGGLLAGLLTLRPDHGLVIRKVRDKLREGRFIVVAHPANEAQAGEATLSLREQGGQTMRSL